MNVVDIQVQWQAYHPSDLCACDLITSADLGKPRGAGKPAPKPGSSPSFAPFVALALIVENIPFSCPWSTIDTALNTNLNGSSMSRLVAPGSRRQQPHDARGQLRNSRPASFLSHRRIRQ